MPLTTIEPYPRIRPRIPWWTWTPSTFVKRTSIECRRIQPTFMSTRLFVTANSDVCRLMNATAPQIAAMMNPPRAACALSLPPCQHHEGNKCDDGGPEEDDPVKACSRDNLLPGHQIAFNVAHLIPLSCASIPIQRDHRCAAQIISGPSRTRTHVRSSGSCVVAKVRMPNPHKEIRTSTIHPHLPHNPAQSPVKIPEKFLV